MPGQPTYPFNNSQQEAYDQEYHRPFLRNYLSGDWRITGDPNAKNDFLSRFDPSFSGIGSGTWGGAGTGLYGSDLLNQLTRRVSGDLANPETSLGMGLLKDQFAGQRATQEQSIKDRYAGYGRGSGPMAAQMLMAQDKMNQSESSAKRQMLSDLLQQSISNAMGLEGMKGGFYNDQQHRLGNEAQWKTSAQGNMLGTLANFLQGMSGQDANNQQTSFQNKLGLDTTNENTRQQNWTAQAQADMPKPGKYGKGLSSMPAWGRGSMPPRTRVW